MNFQKYFVITSLENGIFCNDEKFHEEAVKDTKPMLFTTEERAYTFIEDWGNNVRLPLHAERSLLILPLYINQNLK